MNRSRIASRVHFAHHTFHSARWTRSFRSRRCDPPFNSTISMASGFLILDDGRAFAVRWAAHDVFIRAIADELRDSDDEKPLRDWLYSLLPGPEDVEHLGYGPWLRKSDGEVIQRVLDIRELTKDNRTLFHTAAFRAHEKFISGGESIVPHNYSTTFDRLIAMLNSVQSGESPDTITDWREGHVQEPTGNRIGPRL